MLTKYEKTSYLKTAFIYRWRGVDVSVIIFTSEISTFL